MSREYVESRIRDALKQHKNNPTKARQQIAAWAADDQRLLMGLAKPHLTGIIAHAINRVVSRLDADAEEEHIPDMPQALDMAPDTFGKEILKALSSSNTAVFGKENSAPSTGRKQASQSHIDALKNIASKKKKTDR